MTDNMMNAPKVREVVSSKPISAQGAHDFLTRFLEAERQDVVAEAESDELLVRLEHVCASLTPPNDKTNSKAKKKESKKERKEKRKREKQSEKKNKKSKTTKT